MDSKEMDKPVVSCENSLDQSFWETKWQSQQTAWDIGEASPAIVEYMLGYSNKNVAILIPGCGNAYEAEFLVSNGFTNITLIDIAPKAIELLNEKFIDRPQVNILCEDFFQHQGSYDLILEQTFFCAISPNKREEYAKKTASLLKVEGMIIGLLFDKTFEKKGPPFGGCSAQYSAIFDPYFTIKIMEECYNSILPRTNSEVFINLIKK